MPIKTLGGMFNEPPKSYRRNFIKENVNSVNQLTLLIKGVNTMYRSKTSANIFANHMDCKRSNNNNNNNDLPNKRSIQNLKQKDAFQNHVDCWRPNDLPIRRSRHNSKQDVPKKKTSRPNSKQDVPKKKTDKPFSPKQTFSDRSVQTIVSNCSDNGSLTMNQNENVSLENGTGDLKIDSCTIETHPKSSENDTKTSSNTSVNDTKTSSNNEDHLKSKKLECSVVQNKSDSNGDFCPRGYRLLPENERKQTLKSLNRKYIERVNELNSLSLKNDTLRILTKKIEIEKELKKLDAEILTFDRARVFIKDC